MFKDFHVLVDYRGEIFHGLLLTFYTWLASVVVGLAIGLLIAAFRQRLPRLLALAIDGYIGIFRGTPFLIQLFLLYYGGPFIGLSLPPITAGIVGLSLYASAYFAEIFRSGLMAIPHGQTEAAIVCGLTRTQTLFRVQIPQMLIVIFPSLMNMVIILLKETAVLSVITVSELTATLSNIGSVTFAYVPTLAFLALFYWLSLELLSSIGLAVEKRVSSYITSQG